MTFTDKRSGNRNGRSDTDGRRPPLASQQLQYLLAATIRRVEVFAQVSLSLQVEDFSLGELAYRLIYASLLSYHAKHSQLPSKQVLVTEINARLERDADVDDDTAEEINTILELAFSQKSASWDVSAALGYFKQFREERLLQSLAGRLGSGSSIPIDMAGLLSEAAESANELASISRPPSAESFPDDWEIDEERFEMRHTGIDFIDRPLGGGYAQGEVVVLLGPYGGGKSTLTLQTAIAVARLRQSERHSAGGVGPRQMVYLFSYEDPLRDLRFKSLACAGNVERSTLAVGRRSAFSTPGNLKEYEKIRWKDELDRGEYVECEAERIARVRIELKDCLRFADFSGTSAEEVGQGTKNIDEIAAFIARDLATLKLQGIDAVCHAVFVDYVGAAVQKHVEAAGLDTSQSHNLINNYPLFFKTKVLSRFNAFGMVAHQLGTNAQSYTTGRVGTHTDSAGGRMIAHAANFCFVLSKADLDGLLVFSCSKARRVKKIGDAVLLFDGDFARFLSTQGYAIDAHTNRIISGSESELMVGAAHDSNGESRPGAARAPGHSNTSAAYSAARNNA